MNKKTQQLTAGAMFTAIFAIMLLIDRQTGMAFQEIIMFFLPIPLVGYASRFGLKPGLTVWASMSLISIIVSTPTGIFYAVSQSGIGLLLGVSVYKKGDMTKALLKVMALSAIANVMNTIILASMFGYSLKEDMQEIKSMMTNAFEKSGAPAETINQISSLLTQQYLMQVIVISMILFGLIQGFLVYELSLLILRRLKFYVPKPKSVFLYYPPIWTATLALVLLFLYMFFGARGIDENLPAILQMLGMCGYLYLLCFGYIAILLLIRTSLSHLRIIGIIIATLLMFMVPMVLVVFGIAYIVPAYHDRLLGKQKES